jgi:hypothetical protein
MTRAKRTELRVALLEAAPWLGATEVGPRSVVAGACDRCGTAPRLLPTCGPTSFEALCRDCAHDEGDEAWCEGHLDDGRAARAWSSELPDRWGEAVVLWWIATGEIRGDESMTGGSSPLGEDLGPAVRAALTG